jgi:hypothetical protein
MFAPHIGKLYDNVVSPFFISWNGENFSVFIQNIVNPLTHDTLFQGEQVSHAQIVFGNCVNCLSCGPCFLKCECDGIYVPRSVVADNSAQILYHVHPLDLACKCNKPCKLPQTHRDFAEMYRAQISAPLPNWLRRFSTPTQLEQLINENRSILRNDGVTMTHFGEYIANPNRNDNRPFMIIKRYS